MDKMYVTINGQHQLVTDNNGEWVQRLPCKKNDDTYHFYDNDVNLNKVCMDAIYDQKTGFIVINGNIVYVGIINLPEFMNYNFPDVFYERDDSFPYIILKSFKKDTHTWIEWLKKETKRFKNKKKKLNKKIFSRYREKEKNYFKVMQF